MNQWLNPAAFATPPVATTIGQTDFSPLGGGPAQFVGPGFHRLDFSLFKQFQLTERFRLEFRSEFFNLTNHPNFYESWIRRQRRNCGAGIAGLHEQQFRHDNVDARRSERSARNSVRVETVLLKTVWMRQGTSKERMHFSLDFYQGRTNMVRIVAVLSLLVCLFAIPALGQMGAPGKLELSDNWKLAAAKDVDAGGAAISQSDYGDQAWHPIHRMPATVLEVMQEDGVYSNLYVGMNMLEKVPQDLYKQDWWYRTVFTAPAGYSTYTLEFPGINYRAEIWINGQKVADSKQVVGMYAAHGLNATEWIKPGSPNTLAVKVTPEQLVQDVDGVELADSWFDWINWKYLGYKGEYTRKHSFGASFVPDRNAGIWKPVYLKTTGDVALENPAVNSELSLPQATARLTVYASVHNFAAQPVNGTLKGTISRQGKPTIEFEQSLILSPGEIREVAFASEKYSGLVVSNPDLWWPYTMGNPALYDLRLEFVKEQKVSDSSHIRFGIRSVTQHRDQDEQFPGNGKGGNFYLRVNGRDFRVRGADYTPDLLYRYDPERESEILRYVKDLGINMLRWESKISSEHIVELADEQGIPLMLGWMCCNQWEKWDQWSDEDHRVASQSLRSQILILRPHASVFVWANGSDGRPPEPVRIEYRKILSELRWQNAVVDTVSSFAKDAQGERLWDGIIMEGPYTWRPPTYWFSGKYVPSRGSSVEQGDNEHIPTLESLKKFIPADKLWPINDSWFFHAGAIPGANTLTDVQLAVNRRYGSSSNVAEFVRKAQLAHYENTRAQFENLAAGDWANHKMTLYWMLNSQWPSFYGNIIDYYLSPGGTYFGAKKGLRPLSVIFDAYATGDHSQARGHCFQSDSWRRAGFARTRARLRSEWEGFRRPLSRRHPGSVQWRNSGPNSASLSAEYSSVFCPLSVV